MRGFIYIVLGKNKEAVEVLKTREFADAPVQLAIAYMRLGRDAEAQAAVAKMLKSGPIATIQSWRQAWNFRTTLFWIGHRPTLRAPALRLTKQETWHINKRSSRPSDCYSSP